MFMIFGLIIGLAIIALIALGVAFLLDVVARGVPWKVRALIAALIAGFVPIVLSAGIVVDATPPDASLAVALLPLLIGGLIIALLIGFPAAYFFTRMRERRRGEAPSPDVFE